MSYNGNILQSVGTPDERIIAYGASFDSTNCGLFKGSVDYDFNLSTPVDSFYLVTPYTSDFDLSVNNFSIEAYFNANSFTNDMAILAKDTYGSNFDWTIIIVNNTTLRMATYATSQNLYVTVPPMNVGQWYHVKFQRVAGVNTFYLDGVSYGSNSMLISNSSQVNITIGCTSYNNPGLHFDGYLDKIKIINNGITVLNLEFESIDTGNLTITDATGKVFEILPEPIDIPKYILDVNDIVRSSLVLELDPVSINTYTRSGTTVSNIVDENETGSLDGATWNSTTGVIDLDGVDDKIEFSTVGTGFNPDGLANYSIQVCINNTTDTGGIINIYDYPNPSGNGIEMELFGGVIYVAFTTSDYGYFNYGATGQWVNICFTYDGAESGDSNILKLYIDGVEVAGSYSGTLPSTIDNSTNLPMIIGLLRPGASSFRYLQGSFGHGLIYSKTLSSEEVMQNYKVTKTNFL
jgi:hypothetical protein